MTSVSPRLTSRSRGRGLPRRRERGAVPRRVVLPGAGAGAAGRWARAGGGRIRMPRYGERPDRYAAARRWSSGGTASPAGARRGGLFSAAGRAGARMRRARGSRRGRPTYRRRRSAAGASGEALGLGVALGLGLGGGAVASVGLPLDRAVGVQEGGLPPGTMPSSRARFSRASGWDRLSTSRWRACCSSVSSVVSRFSSLRAGTILVEGGVQQEQGDESAAQEQDDQQDEVRAAVLGPVDGISRASAGGPRPSAVRPVCSPRDSPLRRPARVLIAPPRGCAGRRAAGRGRRAGSRRPPPRWAALAPRVSCFSRGW